jgi:hypothetical protein
MSLGRTCASARPASLGSILSAIAWQCPRRAERSFDYLTRQPSAPPQEVERHRQAHRRARTSGARIGAVTGGDDGWRVRVRIEPAARWRTDALGTHLPRPRKGGRPRDRHHHRAAPRRMSPRPRPRPRSMFLPSRRLRSWCARRRHPLSVRCAGPATEVGRCRSSWAASSTIGSDSPRFRGALGALMPQRA